MTPPTAPADIPGLRLSVSRMPTCACSFAICSARVLSTDRRASSAGCWRATYQLSAESTRNAGDDDALLPLPVIGERVGERATVRAATNDAFRHGMPLADSLCRICRRLVANQ